MTESEVFLESRHRQHVDGRGGQGCDEGFNVAFLHSKRDHVGAAGGQYAVFEDGQAFEACWPWRQSPQQLNAGCWGAVISSSLTSLLASCFTIHSLPRRRIWL